MTPEEAKKELTRCAEIFIQEETDFLKLQQAIDGFRNLMLSISRLDYNATINEENIQLTTGMAIGPKWAGICIEDLLRTKMFICGINKAILDLRKQGKKEPITILYSGTGPFATLVLPLTALYSPEELQLVLLEVNTISIQSLKKVIKGLDIYDYIAGIYHCDAGNFIVPEKFDVDIVIIECLQHALVREPQVGITYNLLPQLKKEVILIPEEITLHVSLIDNDKKNDYMERNDGIRYLDYFEISEPIFILNKEEVLKRTAEKNGDHLTFSEKEVVYSEEKIADNDTLAIATEITIYKEQKLTMDDSGLTVPFILSNLNLDTEVRGVKTQYVVGTDPGFAITLITE